VILFLEMTRIAHTAVQITSTVCDHKSSCNALTGIQTRDTVQLNNSTLSELLVPDNSVCQLFLKKSLFCNNIMYSVKLRIGHIKC